MTQAAPATAPSTASRSIAGRPVWVDGPENASPRRTLVMVHGWPDSARLWDRSVAALASRYRCVRFTLPGYDAADPPRAHSLAELTALIHEVVKFAGGGAPVTLVLHDWGCFFGYHFAQQHPEMVARVVGIDIGDAGSQAYMHSLNWKAKLGVLAYQLTLALAWRIGGSSGDRIARGLAAKMRVPTPAVEIRSAMGYPYWITWTRTHGSYRAARPFDPVQPMYFAYGKRKPFMFHSPSWAESLAARPACQVQGYKSGHWVMIDAAEAFHSDLLSWLARTD